MNQITDLSQLFDSAVDAGTLSADAVQTLNVVDIGAQIQAGLGINVDDVTTSEVTLITQLIDDSGSIKFANNAAAVRNGHNLVNEALKEARQANSILAHCRYLNGTVLYPYSLIQQVPVMTSANYDPMGGTPLYDQTAVLLATVVAKAQEFEENNVPVRAVTLIVTDGADQGSYQHTPRTIRPLIEDLLRTEMHIIAGMGISDGSTDFHQVFRDMGIRDEWILTPGNTDKEIRAAFHLVSQSALRASQGGANFSQAALGGFG
jgi:hypothetical protein